MEFPKPTNRQTAKEKQRSRYETLIFTRLVLLVAVPLLIVGLLCGILYYRSEPAAAPNSARWPATLRCG